MRKSRKLSVLAILAVVLVVGGIWGYASLNGSAEAIDSSRLATVEQDTMVRSVVATGRIEPITKVEIKSKANGIVEKLYVDVDQVVNQGDLLVELDKEQIRARVRELEANFEAKRAALAAAEAQLTKNRVEAESPDVEFARRAYERAKALFEQNLVAQSALDEAKSALETAENRRRAAQGQLVISEARIGEARAAVAEAKAALERAQEELANATIRAPIRGTVLTRDVEIGSPVSSILNLGASATLIMTLGDIDHVFVRGKVDEADIGRVQLGQRAKITVETFRDQTFDGRVTQVSPIGTEKDNVTTFEVKVSIDNARKELKANMTANAEIILEEHPGSLIIPEAAITYDAQRNATVQLLDPSAKNGRRVVTIKTGIGNGTKTQVLSGLKKGDRLILPS
ncbi:MAG TPA: efflux RND transporter periplasmic adaptor subunit [Vicinamibacterales bacterium]|nr:efflux RND transporter periplasmic adaptor subunit [Vicinamibacterales bacterium]